MKNILVPFDFSKTAMAAFDLALDIAKKHKAKVDILYIIIDPFIDQNNTSSTPEAFNKTDVRRFMERIKAESFANLKNVISRSGCTEVKINPFVEFNSSVYKSILRFIDKKKTGLVVMGTHGSKDIKSKVLGTNTERVFRLTKVPVLIVRNKIQNHNFKKIVFASDLETTSKSVFIQAWNIIKVYDAKIDVLRVNTTKDSIRRTYAVGKMRHLTKKYAGNFDYIIKDSASVEEGIEKYCDKEKAELIVLGVHRKKGFKRIFSDRVSEAITRLAKQPILTIDISSK
ncbi:MAG: universal stress protein [Ignavibacteria bacterium]|nr:universal stress protein [Ignavibacteria bacterium]